MSGEPGQVHVALDPIADVAALRTFLAESTLDSLELAPWITAEAIDGLKFSECLPRARAESLVARRLADTATVAAVANEPITSANSSK